MASCICKDLHVVFCILHAFSASLPYLSHHLDILSASPWPSLYKKAFNLIGILSPSHFWPKLSLLFLTI